MNSRRMWAGAILCGLLAGCGQQGVPVPTDRFHRLDVEAPATVYPSPKLAGTLEIERFDAVGILHHRAIVFAEHDNPHVLHQYHYHLWADPPTRLLQDATVEFLREANLAEQVVPAGLRVEPSYTLVGDIKQLEHIVGNSSSIAVELEFDLRDNADGSLAWVKSYTATRQVKDDTVGAATGAISAAIGEILNELSADLARRRAE